MKTAYRIGLALVLATVFSFGHLTVAQQTQPTAHPRTLQKKQGLKLKVTAHSVTLSWTQSVIPTGATCPAGGGTSTAVTANSVYRATAAGGEGTTPYAVLATPSTTYTDTTVTVGTTYFYTVTATNCAGSSPQSSEASATIPNPLVPNAPTGFAATAQ
jgi:hypothetical protein